MHASPSHLPLCPFGRGLLASFAALLLLCWCTTRQGRLAPLDETDVGAGAAGRGGAGGSEGAAGTGAQAGATTTTSTTTSSSSTTGPVCSPVGEVGDCGVGNKCTVVDLVTGETGCAAAGSTADYAVCSANTECGSGSWCDSSTGVCKPVCADEADCGSAGLGLCTPARQAGQPIPGLQLCTAHCHPTLLSPCGPGVSCAHHGVPNDFDCYVSGNRALLQTCTLSADCEPGLVCADGDCAEWCAASEIGTCCYACVVLSCTPCQELPTPLSYDGVAVPACYGMTSC